MENLLTHNLKVVEVSPWQYYSLYIFWVSWWVLQCWQKILGQQSGEMRQVCEGDCWRYTGHLSTAVHIVGLCTGGTSNDGPGSLPVGLTFFPQHQFLMFFLPQPYFFKITSLQQLLLDSFMLVWSVSQIVNVLCMEKISSETLYFLN